MASTVLPNGIIIPEKFSRDWYADLYHNWQELDNLLGGGTPKDGTLTIQKNGSTVGTFSANQATNETIDITVPDVNDGTLTIQQNGTTVDTFTANSSSDKTINIQCVDLTNNQTVGGNKEFTGTTTAHDLVPSATDTYNLGTTANKWKTFNGINPGALSLSSTTRVKVDTTDFVWDGTTQNVIEPPIPCILYILVTASKIAENGTISAGNTVMYTSSQIIKNNVSNCGSNNNYVIASVRANAGDRVIIRLSLSSSLSGSDGVFYRPLLGNV